MSRVLNALPTLARSEVPLESCVTAHTILRGPVAQIVQWRCRRDGEALRTERHHTTYVLSLVASGACWVHDGRWHATVDPVNALLHRPGSTYRTTHPYGFIDSGWNVAYDRDVADEVLSFAGVSRGLWIRPALTVATRPVHLGMRQLVATARQRSGCSIGALELEELALELLESIARDSVPGSVRRRRPATHREHQRIVEAAREFLNAHYSTPLDLGQIAQEAGTSPAHLCRVFRQGVGITLREYLHRLRLSAALEAVALRQASLARAAIQTGFCSQAHLTTVCTRLFGSSPGAVRRLCAPRE